MFRGQDFFGGKLPNPLHIPSEWVQAEAWTAQADVS